MFDFAKLVVHRGAETNEIDSAVMYGDDAMTVSPYDSKKKESDPTIAIPYGNIASAEYTFGKSPSALTGQGSAPAIVANSNAHWLVVTDKNGGSAILTLNRRNYKGVITELEHRSGIHVESVSQGK